MSLHLNFMGIKVLTVNPESQSSSLYCLEVAGRKAVWVTPFSHSLQRWMGALRDRVQGLTP